MKRMIGWGLAVAGGMAAGWGAMCMITGDSQAKLNITHEFSINAMTTGLAGLAVLTLGLVWVRD